MVGSLRLWQRFEKYFSHFNLRAFALQADAAGRNIAAGDLVHGFAVDDDLDGVAAADALKSIPFADGIFGGGREQLDTVLADGERLAARRAALQPEITLMIVHALTLDAVRPDLAGAGVRRAFLHEDADAGVARLHEAPFDRDDEVGIIFHRARVAGRFANAMNESVADAPSVFRRGVGAHKKSPAGEIFAVEQFNVAGGRDGFLCAKKKWGEAEQGGGDEFHGGEIGGRAATRQTEIVAQAASCSVEIMALTARNPITNYELYLSQDHRAGEFIFS